MNWKFLSSKVKFFILLSSKVFARYRQKAILILLLIAGVGVLYKYFSEFYVTPSLTEGIVGTYVFYNLPPTVTILLSDPLVAIDKSGRPQPKLSASWQVNNNATLYTFRLKNEALWSDGTKVKSTDLVFSLPDVEVSYPDESTVQFKLADSFAAFPSLLTSPVLKKNTLLGVGKYKIFSQEVNHNLVSKLILKPVESGSSLPPIAIRFYPDEKTAKVAYDLGEISVLVGIYDTQDFSKSPGSSIKRITNFSRLTAIFYNTKDKILSDKNMRKALTSASPKIEFEERAKTPIQPNSWVFNDQLKDPLGDPILAKSYLEKVGSGKDSTITLTTTPALAQVGEKVVQGWRAAGIPTVLRIESGIPQNFQALLTSQPIPQDPDQYALWHSTQEKTNISKYSSPRIDKDLEDGRKNADTATRKERYLDFQKVLVDDSPATLLYFPKINIVYRGKVEKDLNKVLALQLPT